MAMQMKEGWLTFPSTTGRKQRRETTVVFPTTVRSAQAVMKGFHVDYNNGDHHILEIEMDLDTTISANTVRVYGDFAFRDSSGYYDDPYDGWINFVVIADIA
jgi:hypothetical protein